MRIFLSWSKERSRRLAHGLHKWCRYIIQAIDPWMSEAEIQAGQRWSIEIASRLSETPFGILCVTPENATSPWLLFEAGALAKSLTEGRVVPLLLGMRPEDLKLPLAQFHALTADRNGIERLFLDIHRLLNPPGLTAEMVKENIDAHWGKMERILRELAEDKSFEKAQEDVRGVSPSIAAEIELIKRQNHDLKEIIAELRDIVLASPVLGRRDYKTTVDLSGTWIDEAFDHQKKYADYFEGLLVIAYEGTWPGVMFGAVQGDLFRFSWTRFDRSLGGNGYLRLSVAQDRFEGSIYVDHEQLEGGIWFDQRDVDSMLTEGLVPERHRLIRQALTVDANGRGILEKAHSFLRAHDLLGAHNSGLNRTAPLRGTTG